MAIDLKALADKLRAFKVLTQPNPTCGACHGTGERVQKRHEVPCLCVCVEGTAAEKAVQAKAYVKDLGKCIAET